MSQPALVSKQGYAVVSRVSAPASSGDRDAHPHASAAPLPAWMPASPEAQTAAYEQRSSGLQSLKFREIEAVRKQMMIDARNTCHETRAAYVECAKGGDPATTQPRGCSDRPRMPDRARRACAGRTLSVVWACRGVFREFNDCLKLQCAHSPRPATRAAAACSTAVRPRAQDN